MSNRKTPSSPKPWSIDIGSTSLPRSHRTRGRHPRYESADESELLAALGDHFVESGLI
ncbi:MAG: hypothetical protein R3C05_01230 [Pirellulaceae bacterium]